MTTSTTTTTTSQLRCSDALSFLAQHIAAMEDEADEALLSARQEVEDADRELLRAVALLELAVAAKRVDEGQASASMSHE
jgi:hypothetical protein